MPQTNWSYTELLIWAKTYPEVSSKYLETVCTGAVRLDNGLPIRLYPIPFRYLDLQFHKYQKMTALIARNVNDARPESFKIDCDSIRLGEVVSTTQDEWGKRAEIVFRNPNWQYESVDALKEAQQKGGRSLGVVTPRKISSINALRRSEEDRRSYNQKVTTLRKEIEARRAQLTMFEQAIPPEMKTHEFLGDRVQIGWLCAHPDCTGHEMQVLDWEICELQRRNGVEAAVAKLKQICDLSNYALRFFLGNLYLYPTSFTIVGIWYPRRANLLF